MVRELVNIVRHNNIKLAVRVVNLSNLQDLHVVAYYIVSHLEGRDIYNVHEWVLHCKDPADLCILSLQELLHAHTLHLRD